jgi:hypothetical protein
MKNSTFFFLTSLRGEFLLTMASAYESSNKPTEAYKVYLRVKDVCSAKKIKIQALTGLSRYTFTRNIEEAFGYFDTLIQEYTPTNHWAIAHW